MREKVLCVAVESHVKLVFSDDVLEKLKSRFEVTFNKLRRNYTSSEIAKEIAGYDALITGWGTPPLTEKVFVNADKLKIIVHSAGSVKYMLSKDVVKKYIIPRRICVCNAPQAIAYNVAETTIGLLIMAGHRFVDHIMNVKGGGWKNPKIPRHVKTLNGSIIGIVGASRVGREVIRLLKPYDAKILVYDPYLTLSEAEELGVEKVDLEDLFRRSDFVSIHAPLTEETYHMIGEKHLRLLKEGAILVNTSRGKVIDQDALVRECETGRIIAALDVTDPEPLPADSPLRKFPNVILTPHIAGNGTYGLYKIGEMTLKALEDFFSGRPVENRIDFKVYDRLA